MKTKDPDEESFVARVFGNNIRDERLTQNPTLPPSPSTNLFCTILEPDVTIGIVTSQAFYKSSNLAQTTSAQEVVVGESTRLTVSHVQTSNTVRFLPPLHQYTVSGQNVDTFTGGIYLHLQF